MKPVLVISGTDYVVCFDTEPEDMSMRYHFMNECGWTEEQLNEIQDFDWFSAEVSLWRDGECKGEEYLGACCYKYEDEFWTTYAADYFSDMVCELSKVTGDAQIRDWAYRWRKDLRTPSPTVKEPA